MSGLDRWRCRVPRPNQTKHLANDGSAFIEMRAKAFADTGKVLKMSLAPVRKTAVSFAFDRSVRFSNLVEWKRLHINALDYGDWSQITSQDDACRPDLGQRLAQGCELHGKARGGPLRAGKNQIGKLIRDRACTSKSKSVRCRVSVPMIGCQVSQVLLPEPFAHFGVDLHSSLRELQVNVALTRAAHEATTKCDASRHRGGARG